MNQQFDLIIGWNLALAASYVQLGPSNGVIYDLKKDQSDLDLAKTDLVAVLTVELVILYKVVIQS